MINSKDYSDIIHLAYHGSSNRKKMSMSDRAAQFAPFAALTGHDEAIKETARLVDQKIELDESQKALLDLRFQEMNEGDQITIIYFQKDLKKAGGAYLSKSGIIKKVDIYQQTIEFDDGLKIAFETMYDLILEK